MAFLFSGTYQIAAPKLSNERCALQLATNFVQHILISQHPKGIKSARGCWKYCLAKATRTHARPQKANLKNRDTNAKTKKNRIWLSLGTHRAPLGALQQQIINANPDPVCLFFFLISFRFFFWSFDQNSTYQSLQNCPSILTDYDDFGPFTGSAYCDNF